MKKLSNSTTSVNFCQPPTIRGHLYKGLLTLAMLAFIGLIAWHAGAFGLCAQASPLSDFDRPNSHHFAYWTDNEGTIWRNNYNQCLRTNVDNSYTHDVLHAIGCGDARIERIKEIRALITTGGWINFEFNSYTLDDEAMKSVDSLILLLRDASDVHITIVGHTDAVGGDEYNLKLGQLRADTVAAKLREAGIENVRTSSAGKRDLLIDTPLPERRNRRVDVDAVWFTVHYIIVREAQ